MSLLRGARVGHRLEDRAQVADRQPLAQQAAHHAHQVAQLIVPGIASSTSLGASLPIAPSSSCTSWRPTSSCTLRRMVSDRCVVITDGGSTTVSPADSARARSVRHDPQRVQAERRLLGRDAVEPGDVRRAARRIQHHEAIDVGAALADLDAAQADPVLVGVEAQVVAQVHRRQHHAEVGGDLLAQAGHAARQLAALVEIDDAAAGACPTSSSMASTTMRSCMRSGAGRAASAAASAALARASPADRGGATASRRRRRAAPNGMRRQPGNDRQRAQHAGGVGERARLDRRSGRRSPGPGARPSRRA